MVECRKHYLNDPKCSELGWNCTPLAVVTYGCWGAEARETLSSLATRLAIPIRCNKSQATAFIYGRLSLTLARFCARSLLSRAGPSLVITGLQYSFVVSCLLIMIYLLLLLYNITPLICPAILMDYSRMSGAASAAAETRKILTNGPKCQELGWTCIPLAVEAFCNWGKEAHSSHFFYIGIPVIPPFLHHVLSQTLRLGGYLQ